MRLFVAVWPPAEVVGRISNLARPEQRGVRWTTPDQWHVTLRFLGSVADVEVVKAALAPLEWGAGLTAVAGPAVARLGPGILCLPVAGLNGLADAARRSTAALGEPPPHRPREQRQEHPPFKGHLTLARAKPRTDLRPLAGAPFDAAWPVQEFTLVASQTHPQGARYEVLARFPIGR